MKMEELSSVSFGRWGGILTTLGADAKYLKGINKPCPFCGGIDRYSYYDEGVGKWFCRQCGHGDGFDWLCKMHGWPLKKAMAEVEAIVGTVKAQAPKPKPDDAAKVRYMARIWREARPITPGDAAWLYLQRRSGDPTGVQEVRFHPALEHSIDHGKHPAMLARMRNPDGTKAIGIHRTYLDEYGFKAQVDPIRMSLGEVGTVQLYAAQECLGIAEGIETAICASKRFLLPVWAAICANGVEKWEPPDGVSSVVVFGDNDESATGQAAAYTLAQRLHRMGLKVSVQIPPELGTDWADVFLKEVG